MEDTRVHGLCGAAWPGPCCRHLQSKWSTERRESDKAAPGEVQQRQTCCTAQTLHPPSELLQFSARTPRHEIQPLTSTLHETGVGKPSTGAHSWRASQQVSHACLSLQLLPVKGNSSPMRCTRQIPRPLLFSAGSQHWLFQFTWCLADGVICPYSRNFLQRCDSFHSPVIQHVASA